MLPDSDECLEKDLELCDVNAYCLYYMNELSYDCVCKEDYNGDGNPGNCEKERADSGKKRFSKTIQPCHSATSCLWEMERDIGKGVTGLLYSF